MMAKVTDKSPVGFSLVELGSKELEAAMADLSKNIQRRVVAKALKKGAEIVLKRARELVPVETGRLRDSLRIRQRRGKRDKIDLSVPEVIITTSEGQDVAGGLFTGDAWYGGFVEYGHAVRGKKKRRKVKTTIGRILREVTQALGAGPKMVPPQSFLRRARDEKADEVRSYFRLFIEADLRRRKLLG